jgi:DNA-binding transcriptional LysR family regulator
MFVHYYYEVIMMYDFNDIDLNLYKMFYMVYKYGNFSKAAEELGITQPAISYNIKKLEQCLNVKLFERGTTILQLTPEAEGLIPYIEEALNSLKMSEIKMNELITLKRGQISIGVPSHIGVFLLTDIIKQFTNKYPYIKIRVTSKPTKELFKLINNNELDIVIDCSPLDNIYNLKVIRITSEKCAFACNKNRKELLDNCITLGNLNKYNLIVPARTSGSTKELIKIYEKNNISFDPSFEIATSDMIGEMVEKDIGVGYLFEKTIETYDNLRKINLDIKLPVFDIYMIYKEKLLSITTKSFIDFVIENIKEN